MEDEWEREIESEVDLDLLFVDYDPSRITIAQLIETVVAEGFTAEVREEP